MLAKMSLCSAEEDGGSLDVEDHDDLHSPTDVSEDSVEVRVTAITSKRKLGHSVPPTPQQCPLTGDRGPRGDVAKRTGTAGTALPPSPKRRRPASPLSPFRPWSAPSPIPTRTYVPVVAPVPVVPVPVTVPLPQEEPLALVKTRVSTATTTVPVIPRTSRSPRGARHAATARAATSAAKSPTPSSKPAAPRFTVESIIGDVATTPATPAPSSQGTSFAAKDNAVDSGDDADEGPEGPSRGQQRNYKNMTRERRIEANARERTRVHTISAAFDTLRRSVPAYSHSQKLSKLSVLRIACSYILTLSRVAGMDYSADQSQPPVQECVDLVTRTIQTEGKLRRKRDD